MTVRNKNGKALFPFFVFGPVPYWSALIQFEEVIFEIHEHFLKQSPRSRYAIYGNTGKQTLSILLKKKSSKTALKDIRLSYDEPWKKLHLRSLATAYSSSPFYEYYIDDLINLYNKKHHFLIDFTEDSMVFTLNALQIELNFDLSKRYEVNETDVDYRSHDFSTIKQPKPYNQVMMDVGAPFIPNLSILDLVFNKGPESVLCLKR